MIQWLWICSRCDGTRACTGSIGLWSTLLGCQCCVCWLQWGQVASVRVPRRRVQASASVARLHLHVTWRCVPNCWSAAHCCCGCLALPDRATSTHDRSDGATSKLCGQDFWWTTTFSRVLQHVLHIISISHQSVEKLINGEHWTLTADYNNTRRFELLLELIFCAAYCYREHRNMSHFSWSVSLWTWSRHCWPVHHHTASDQSALFLNDYTSVKDFSLLKSSWQAVV